jgi:DNA polymerase III subunit beta
MKFEIEQSVLAEAAALCASVAGNRSLPVLDNVRIEAKDEHVTLFATDAQSSIRLTRAAKVIKPGASLADAKTLADRSRSLPEGTVTVEETDVSLVLKSGRRRFAFQTVSVDDFVQEPTPEGSVYTIATAPFLAALKGVRHAISSDYSRENLCGLHVGLGGGEIRLVATDGHRLATDAVSYDGPVGRLFLPNTTETARHSFVDMLRKFVDGSERFELRSAGSKLFAAVGDDWIATSVGRATMPPYEQVIPKSCTGSATFDREEMISAVSALVGASKKVGDKTVTYNMIFEVGSGSVRVLVDEPGSNAEDSVDADVTGEARIGICGPYVLDALKALECERAVMRFSGPLDPVLFEDGSRQLVVMPFRT